MDVKSNRHVFISSVAYLRVQHPSIVLQRSDPLFTLSALGVGVERIIYPVFLFESVDSLLELCYIFIKESFCYNPRR